MSLPAIFSSAWRHRELLWQLARREVIGRYRGSALGLLWSFFNPLLMLMVYTFVFGTVFKPRWEHGAGTRAEFAILLFSGMIVHGLFAECVTRAPLLILANVNFVKRVIFPLEILPWVVMGSAIFHTAVSLAVLFLFAAVVQVPLHWTVALLPFVVFPLIMLTMGVCWFLASTSVFIRDLNQTIGIAVSLLMFLSPVFYPVTAVPQVYRPLLYLNPLTFVIEQTRELMIWGKLPDWSGLLVYTLCSIVIAWLGFAWFQKTRRGFADVL
jgi:lipopolysaccharide transport system permease protein